MQNVVLQFADVIKRYGASTALDGLDLRVQGGELLALLGVTDGGGQAVLGGRVGRGADGDAPRRGRVLAQG